MMTENNSKQQPVRKRRHLTAEKKYQMLHEIQAHPEKKAEILRREGLYGSDLSRFEEIAREGALKALKNSKPGKRRKDYDVPMEEHERLKAELARKEKALADLTVDFTVLKKKVNGE